MSPVDTELTPALPSSPRAPSRAIIPFGRGWSYPELYRNKMKMETQSRLVQAAARGSGCNHSTTTSFAAHMGHPRPNHADLAFGSSCCSPHSHLAAQGEGAADPAGNCPSPAQPLLPASPGARNEVPAKPSRCPGAQSPAQEPLLAPWRPPVHPHNHIEKELEKELPRTRRRGRDGAGSLRGTEEAAVGVRSC